MEQKNKDLLTALLNTDTPSGLETAGTELFVETVKGFTSNHRDIISDKIGNVAVGIGAFEAPEVKVLLSAHIDEIGLRVQYIDDNGFIYVFRNGGVDVKTLLGSRVRIHNKKNGITMGVIGKTPIHVERRAGTESKEIKLEDIKIDCGFSSKEEALTKVAIGDCIIIDSSPLWLNDNLITSKGLDDKAGVYVVTRVLEELSKVNLIEKGVAVYGGCCVQEETTQSGATSLIKLINPNVSIDYDVTFATDDGRVEAKEWGDVKLGHGGCIVHSPDCNISLVDKFKETAELTQIPTQEFAVGGGMTNTQNLKQFGFNVETALLSIPLRNMHTQAEIVDIRDLEALVKLTVETIMLKLV